MKTIIAGSRNASAEDFEKAMEQYPFIDEITTVISGTAAGPDIYGEAWASENNIPIIRFFPDWRKYGRAAGHTRNKEMADCGEALIAVWDGFSKGTKNMIDTANRQGLLVFVHHTGDD